MSPAQSIVASVAAPETLVLDIELGGSAVDQYDQARLGLAARGQLSRGDFGFPFSQTPGGIALVADKMDLVLDIEAILRT